LVESVYVLHPNGVMETEVLLLLLQELVQLVVVPQNVWHGSVISLEEKKTSSSFDPKKTT